MNREITKDDVLAYDAGWITDPDERRAIEQAREQDPVVRRWFARLTGDEPEQVPDPYLNAAEALADRWLREVSGGVFVAPGERSKPVLRYDTRVAWGKAAARTGNDSPPELEPDSGLPYEIDLNARVVRFTFPAAQVPFGVARITAEIDGERVGSTLAAFREWGNGSDAVCQAEVKLADLGVPHGSDSGPTLYPVIADADNLAEFAAEEVRQLRDRCNGGDRQLRAVVNRLLVRLEQGEAQ